MRVIELAALATVAACYQPASYESCTIACSDLCPPGYTCDRGLCRADGAPPCAAPQDAPLPTDAPDPVPPDATPDSAVPNACPLTYAVVDGARYRYVSTAASWLDAVADCADDLSGTPNHTHLVVLTSDAEASRVDSLNSGMTAWIGLSDRVASGTFQWVTAEPTSYPPVTGSPWNPSPPSSASGDDCVQMRLADFSATNCTAVRVYYCECDTYANDPARY